LKNNRPLCSFNHSAFTENEQKNKYTDCFGLHPIAFYLVYRRKNSGVSLPFPMQWRIWEWMGRNISNLDSSGKETPTDKGKNFLSYLEGKSIIFFHLCKKFLFGIHTSSNKPSPNELDANLYKKEEVL